MLMYLPLAKKTRSLSNKDSKERENQQHKTGSGARTPRPRTAPPKPPKKMLSRPESAQSTPTPRLDKDLGTAATLNTTSKPKISSKIKEDKKTKDTKNKITKQEEKPVKQDKPVDKKLENLKSDVSKRSISKPTSKGASRDTSRPPSAIGI
ncbi:uncharacterized protein LOC111709988 isoform X2 [Eurytemora carolleeae]|uniref:uncharacterized protein LOC111709988 isoform X2 n=1 Tax=Eurytemora carolleeae TaxID=1294199 RepID=UPI000C7791A8|nr:uncharacterized protein LOC111709988 isoform X2 [Eurytemora carolleeae]|eukprot:XP_023339739.1 uncharacterized protein LOC111709988 isoform X2 [Eurytemora affinis]